jgi:hypothetical protein
VARYPLWSNYGRTRELKAVRKQERKTGQPEEPENLEPLTEPIPEPITESIPGLIPDTKPDTE